MKRILVFCKNHILWLLPLFTLTPYFAVQIHFEKQNYSSISNTVCGKLVKQYDSITKNKRGRNYYFDIQSQYNQTYTFSKNATLGKQLLSPYYDENKIIFKNFQYGEKYCISYSLLYNEADNSVPYLIQIRRA